MVTWLKYDIFVHHFYHLWTITPLRHVECETLGFQGVIIPDRSTYYGSRSMFDQHRDMRLDIDDMGYEVSSETLLCFAFCFHLAAICSALILWHEQELLALGERIGHVNTGLSEELISKCMTESIYCSSGQNHEEGNCVICLVSIVILSEMYIMQVK